MLCQFPVWCFWMGEGSAVPVPRRLPRCNPTAHFLLGNPSVLCATGRCCPGCLAGGLPVVMTDDPELARWAVPAVLARQHAWQARTAAAGSVCCRLSRLSRTPAAVKHCNTQEGADQACATQDLQPAHWGGGDAGEQVDAHEHASASSCCWFRPSAGAVTLCNRATSRQQQPPCSSTMASPVACSQHNPSW